MAGRKSPALTARATAQKPSSASNVYSAQIFANFCEVDLKTVHHWADRGKVAHFRTEGRHLRFRRNDVVRFLRAHGYPLPDQLVRARPTIALALPGATLERAPLSLDELAKRLGSRFTVRRHACAAHALSHLVAEAPDAVVLAGGDPTLGAGAIAALKDDPATSWIVFIAVPETAEGDLSWTERADIVVIVPEIPKRPGEVARALAVV